jgi:hypothetical protein
METLGARSVINQFIPSKVEKARGRETPKTSFNRSLPERQPGLKNKAQKPDKFHSHSQALGESSEEQLHPVLLVTRGFNETNS